MKIMIRKWLAILLMLPVLSACEPTNKAWQSAKDWVQNWRDVPAPNARDFVIQPLPQVSDNELNFTAQTYQRPPSQTKITPQILHFDADGKAVDVPENDGFYREVYGQTADGRLMVQDFFEATKLPQTTALILKKNSDPKDFSNAILDGRVIWFNRDGQLHAVADYANGVAQGARVFYQNKQLVGAMLAQKMLAFQHDGTILAAMENGATQPNSNANNEWRLILFRPNGVGLLQSDIRGEQVVRAVAWTADGKQVKRKADVQTVRQESLPFEKRADELLRLMNE